MCNPAKDIPYVQSDKDRARHVIKFNCNECGREIEIDEKIANEEDGFVFCPECAKHETPSGLMQGHYPNLIGKLV
jgi:translation initiation factor 2 beta subunit (eIF-2beta)/eIF-5